MEGEETLAGDKYEYSFMAFMANISYDFTLQSIPLTFFPTAGVGIVNHSFKGMADVAGTPRPVDDSQMTVASHVGAGVRFNFTPKQSIELVARYAYMGEPEYDIDGTNAILPIDTTGFNVTIGYKYWF